MIPAIIGWVLPLVLLLSCSWVAASAWTSSGPAAARSRRRLLAALLETASVAVFMRLVVDWSPVTIWLWALSVAALAAGTAGTVIRWDSLPRTASVADAAPGADPAAARAESKRGRRGGQSREPGTITLGSYALVLAAAVAVSAAIG